MKERYRDTKTPKVCEQGWVVNVGPKIKQSAFIQLYISTFHCYKARAILM